MELPQDLDIRIAMQLDPLQAKAKGEEELNKMQSFRIDAIKEIRRFCQAIAEDKGYFIKIEVIRGIETLYSLYYIQEGKPTKFWIWDYMPHLGARINKQSSNLPHWTFHNREYSRSDRLADAFTPLAKFLAALGFGNTEDILKNLIDTDRLI